MNQLNRHIDLLERILNPLLPFYETICEFGDWESGQGEAISWYEMFARSVYGIIPYTSLVGDNVFVKAYNTTLLKVIKDSRYTLFVDGDQKAVEMIPLVSMLYIHRKLTWDTYDGGNKSAILAYFSNINKIYIGTDNWQFFRVIVSSILNALGGNEDQQFIDNSWEEIDRCYCGNGWYRDGASGPKDYYVAFGYHFYSLLFRYLFPEQQERNELIKERAQLFAKDYKHLFDAEGRMIVYGRSMIYRFASLSFWSMYLLNGLGEDDTCFIESLIDTSLGWWEKQKIFDSRGLLNLGIAYRNENICEFYNSAGSPYWALKAFFFLMYKGGAQYETEKSKQSMGICSIANDDMVVAKNERWSTAYINSYTGVEYVSNNSAKYMRFAYNSATGFNISKNPCAFNQLSDDNSLVFNIGGVKHQREANKYYKNHGSYQEFLWSCGDLVNIRTIVVPMQYGYLRLHIVRSKINVNCIETGFAIPTVSNGIMSGMTCLYGHGITGCIQNEVNSNIYHPHTNMPVIRYYCRKGYNMLSDFTYLIPAAIARKGMDDYCKVIHHCFFVNIYYGAEQIKVKFNPLHSIPILCFNFFIELKKYIRSFYNHHSWLKSVYKIIRVKK